MTDASQGPAHVLAADDSSSDLLRLVDLLGEHDMRVTTARTGTQAYELAQQSLPDVILLEARIPDMDGLACCRLLQANPATHAIPVIFVSAAGSPAERVAGLAAGAVDYVVKPFDRDEMLARIGVQLRRVGRAPAAPPALFHDDMDGVLLNAAQRLIGEHLGNLPELPELASRVGTYRERLTHVFRERLGVSVFGYVRELRLERGMALLRDTALEVRDIAQLVGFQNAGSFSTALRERTGTTPTAYRAQARRDGKAAQRSTGSSI